MINGIGLSRRVPQPSPATPVAQDRISYLFITQAARASPPAFPAKFSDGQGSSDLQTQHSFSASIMGWGGWGVDTKSRWCEIDDLNTSSINAAADVVFGDWWRIQAIHLSNRQPSVKILRRFSVSLFSVKFCCRLLVAQHLLTNSRVSQHHMLWTVQYLRLYRNGRKYCHKGLVTDAFDGFKVKFQRSVTDSCFFFVLNEISSWPGRLYPRSYRSWNHRWV